MYSENSKGGHANYLSIATQLQVYFFHIPHCDTKAEKMSFCRLLLKLTSSQVQKTGNVRRRIESVREEGKGLKEKFKTFSFLLATSYHHPDSPQHTSLSKELAAEAGHINSSVF